MHVVNCEFCFVAKFVACKEKCRPLYDELVSPCLCWSKRKSRRVGMVERKS